MQPVSRFPVPDVADLPEDLRERILAVQEKTGFVPNVFLALAHRPAELRAFLAYHDALMEGDGGLTKAEREMIVVATSAARSCTYCVVAHGAILRIRARDPLLADLVATNYRSAGLPERQRRMLDFAVKLSTTPELVEERDLDVLRAAGFDDEQVWDISAITSFFALSNRMALVMALRPNEQFHLLGRVPRS
ncbi:MAG: hypothetical protein AVDCRST_MAG07-2497 [uncultured Frankineae bacterium]|uniref:Carboxymuconolactone decarboxylase-like domain-containing protein n=1 Tax=uncultured Frankineae bacterium TaxID=437475 RepID=A0A6J4LLU8_9ACTN|nr:MAG: hypothetical protein AVDCRST_MAG07-2497 [uncultured Frankineae bacterium]